VLEIDTLCMEQQDGGAPTTLAAGSAPGESGASVLSVRFDGGMHLLATGARCHCICFQTSPGRVEKRMADRLVCVERRAGSLSIYPAGVDCAADADTASRFLWSRSIRAGWRWQPRNAHCPRRGCFRLVKLTPLRSAVKSLHGSGSTSPDL
jgi:hypothetical protein